MTILHIVTQCSQFLSYYVTTHVTTRSAEVVRMTHFLYFIKAINAAAWNKLRLAVACRSQRPRGIRSGSVASRLLPLWVRIQLGQGCVSLVSVECVVWCLSPRGVDQSSRGVVPTVVCLCVILKPQEWGGLGPLGLSSYEKFVDYLTHKCHTISTQKL